MGNVNAILSAIQFELKAPKGQYNSFGKYNYRSCEDILEAVKPLLKKHGGLLTISDEMFTAGDRVYVKATATFTDNDGSVTISSTAFAREPNDQKGQSESQITGTASSYARKYALNGLFLIDDAKDADTDEYRGGSPGATRQAESPRHEASGGSKFTKEMNEEMKKWADGTFSPEELASIKRGLSGADWKNEYESARKAYAERHDASIGGLY